MPHSVRRLWEAAVGLGEHRESLRPVGQPLHDFRTAGVPELEFLDHLLAEVRKEHQSTVVDRSGE